MSNFLRAVLVFALFALTSGCIGTIVGQTTSAAIEASNVSLTEGGTVIGVANVDDVKNKDD